MFEILTLMQTEKLAKQIQIILYGTEYWNRILNLDPMVEWGAIGEHDLQLLQRADTPAAAFELLKAHLTDAPPRAGDGAGDEGAGNREDEILSGP